MSQYWSIHKYTWIYADGKTLIQIHHGLTDKRRHQI